MHSEYGDLIGEFSVNDEINISDQCPLQNFFLLRAN